MTIVRHRNVVLGAGAVGLAAAYHLARRGEPVLVVEQFALGHDRGSSHGAARITRHSYADPVYARLMPAAFAAWRGLEADAGETLYIRTGGVSFGPAEVGYVTQVAANLEEFRIPHRRMSGAEWNAGHASFRMPGDWDVVFEPDAGMLKASRALEAMADQARQLGPATRILEGTPIRRVDLEAARPTLVTDDGLIEAERLIVTAGAWTGRLIPSLARRLRPTRQSVFYFRQADGDAYALGRFPVFIYLGPGELDAFYGMPAALGMGVKVARHGGPDVDPDRSDREVAEADEGPVRAFLRLCLPTLADASIDRAEVCLYTMAPDDQFQVALHPGRDDVVVASPCSGHGFKFSCLVGSILADLALERQTAHDIAAWRVLL
jgi:sarcosine oxidase